ncbi:MAG TPA: cytochrome P450 [Thermomicrobiales bacterium]|nr:cytochrome P450 [Thermomicrobiales bacterium]
MSDQPLDPFNLAEAYANGDPYPTYARFRAADPIHIQHPTGDGTRTWRDTFLFRHADCYAALRDPRLGKWERPPDAPQPEPNTFQAVAGNFMLFRNPPAHSRLRGTANLAFTPRQVERLRPSIESLAADLARSMREQEGPVDLISQFAFPLPMLVIAQMLGIPREDFLQFRSLAGDVAAAIDFPLDGLAEFVARVDRSTAELSDYFRDLVAARRAVPRDDLLTALIAAGQEAGRLSDDELIATCLLLLVAGHETTVNLIGNGTLALLTHRKQWETLKSEPDLARNATEELLRYDAPVQLTTRLALTRTEIGGIEIPAGGAVTTVLGSANRDEAVFTDPERLDIRREVGRIMSFGMGIHFCLGAPLARLEGEIAFRTLAQEFPELALANDIPVWRPGAVFHGLRDLPLTLN